MIAKRFGQALFLDCGLRGEGYRLVAAGAQSERGEGTGPGRCHRGYRSPPDKAQGSRCESALRPPRERLVP
ncbi:unnamed protein product, partial [Iphiclides podalirius]